MRGLAFPPNDEFERELSSDHGTPFGTVTDITIDPALGRLPIGPALVGAQIRLASFPVSTVCLLTSALLSRAP